jgi:hypothetical protein
MKHLIAIFFLFASLAHAQQKFVIGLCSDAGTGAKAVKCNSLRTESNTHYKLYLAADGTGTLTPQDVKSADIPITGKLTSSGSVYALTAQSAPKADGSFIQISLTFQYFPPPAKFPGNAVWDMHFRSGTIQTETK